jgi:FkbM family methyltransferase
MQPAIKTLLKSVYEHVPLKQPLFELVRRRVKVPPAIYRHLHFRGVFSTDVNGRSFQMHHFGYLVENEVFWSGVTGGFEGKSLELWKRLCAGSSAILDVGANTGLFALVAKTVNPGARVWAFEPVQRVFERLRKNCTLNGFDVVCEPLALSDRDGSATIWDVPADHTYSVTINKNLHGAEAAVVEQTIPIAALDTYIDKHQVPRIDLIKLDVETHEPEVLEGFRRHLPAMKPTFLIEVIREEVGRRIEEQVASLGYLYFDIDENRGPRRVEHIRPGAGLNYLLCSQKVARGLDLS